MIILDKKYTVKELNEINVFVNGFVKGVNVMASSVVEWEYWILVSWKKQRR